MFGEDTEQSGFDLAGHDLSEAVRIAIREEARSLTAFASLHTVQPAEHTLSGLVVVHCQVGNGLQSWYATWRRCDLLAVIPADERQKIIAVGQLRVLRGTLSEPRGVPAEQMN